MGNEKEPINIKNFGGTPLGLCPVCPVDMSICPVICPVCPADILRLECEFPHKSAQSSRVSLGRPEFIPRTPPARGIPTAKFLYVIFLIGFLFSIVRFQKRRVEGWDCATATTDCNLQQRCPASTNLKVCHCSGSLFDPNPRSLKNYQYNAEGQKRHQNLIPVLIIWENLRYFPGKFLPVLVFTGAAP